MGGLALQEVGMAPKKSEEVMSEKRSNKEEVIRGNKEDVKSNTSMDKGFGGDNKVNNTGALSAKKSSLVEGGEEEEEELAKVEKKKRAPSICSCEYEFYHSRNLHQNTSIERQK